MMFLPALTVLVSYSAVHGLSSCPAPAAYDANIVYPVLAEEARRVDNSDNYANYCHYMVNEHCQGLCGGSFASNCANECSQHDFPPETCHYDKNFIDDGGSYDQDSVCGSLDAVE